MTKIYPVFLSVISVILSNTTLNAQCVNADFGNASFANWTGTWGDANCSYTVYNQNAGFVQGPLNDPPNDAATSTIMLSVQQQEEMIRI